MKAPKIKALIKGLKQVAQIRDEPHICPLELSDEKYKCELDNIIRPYINKIKNNTKLSKVEQKKEKMNKILSEILQDRNNKKYNFSAETKEKLSDLIVKKRSELDTIFGVDNSKDYIKYLKYANAEGISLEQVFQKKYLLYDYQLADNLKKDIFYKKYLLYKNKYLKLKQLLGL